MATKKKTGTPVGRARLTAGLSGYALAKLVGIAPSHMARIEKGECRPSVDLALRIADALKSDVSALFRRKAA